MTDCGFILRALSGNLFNLKGLRIKVLIKCIPCKVQSVLIILVGENQTAEDAREVFAVFLRVTLRFAK